MTTVIPTENVTVSTSTYEKSSKASNITFSAATESISNVTTTTSTSAEITLTN